MLEPRPSGNRKLVRRAVAACAALALAAFIGGLSAVSAFAVTCSGGATMSIAVAGGESIALSLSGVADPLAIVVTPSDPSCGGFDTSTVTAIQVNGADGDESVTIDQSGSAPFPHQNTTSINLALGAGADALVILGQTTADTIGFGADGISLDAGGTPAVTGIGTVESFTVDAGGGDDSVSGKEGGGLGGELLPTAITIHGEAGNDALTGGSGNDTINGGTGSDTLKGAVGGDTLDGGAGSDVVSGGDGDDTVDGGAGKDRVKGGDNGDTLDGGGGDDTLTAGEGDDVVDGGDGNDVLSGGGDDDDVNGGPGRDQLSGGPGNDRCLGGPDPDSITACESGHP